jgi:hypothetical protein
MALNWAHFCGFAVNHWCAEDVAERVFCGLLFALVDAGTGRLECALRVGQKLSFGRHGVRLALSVELGGIPSGNRIRDGIVCKEGEFTLRYDHRESRSR